MKTRSNKKKTQNDKVDAQNLNKKNMRRDKNRIIKHDGTNPYTK